MKKQLFTVIFFSMVLSGMGQFVPQPLNYPGPGYWPFYISISDPDHVWVGTISESGLPYSFCAKTNNGGDSWIFDSIPVPGEPFCTSICQWDSNTCFFVFTDYTQGGGSIWKTFDGGTNWSNMTTDQFVGGFANFYHAFSPDTGVAMGDPTDGYFEIQLTTDGGTSWTRISSANIPLPLPGEVGLNDAYAAVDNSIWFATSKGRCYRSTDRGLNWNVTQVGSGSEGSYDVCFSTGNKGAFWRQDAYNIDIAVTVDGGINWDTVSFPTGYAIGGMSSVGGFDGGFVITGFNNLVDVFFTPDMFNSLITIGSHILSFGIVSFLDASTGWLSDGESGTNEILKYTGLLTSVNSETRQQGTKLLILPNPTSNQALMKLPDIENSGSLIFQITDLNGRVIRQSVVEAAGWTTLDSSSLSDGIYMVRLLSGNELIACDKWVVSH